MKNFNLILLFLLGSLSLISCSERGKSLTEYSIIPEPIELIADKGTFTLNDDTQLIVIGDSLDFEIQFLREIVRKEISLSDNMRDNVIVLEINDAIEGKESYEMSIQKEKVHISASSKAGIFYGIQTFRQLLPAGIEGEHSASETSYQLPLGEIKDSPNYSYRGMMLDVARHFFEVEEVLVLIDRLAKYKINHLHLHLSDDQGWRIEIKSWPLLTKIGGSTEVGGGKGGYYTQEDYQKIVQYAEKRHITIVPEIDLPGHTNSATASYGILNPGIKVPQEGSYYADRKALGVEEIDPKASPLYTGIEVGYSTLDYNSPVTYQFVDDVIRELADLTPGPYLHIGGDETLVVSMEDYIPFMEKVQSMVQKYGKTAIGWDEMAHAKMLPGNVAQFWAKEENARMAIDQGNQVLFSPSTKVYLDMQYDSTTQLGLHWAAYIEVNDAYNWDPQDLVKGIKKENILGIEGPMWTETISNRADFEYMLFPRITAVAEIGWSPQEKRNWENYQRKLKDHYLRWDQMNINYYKSPQIK
jgi:hexosaminidase